ncbi:hypothetical protein A2954_03245 [Candidatus Roizmanbacteria bacterium RIFCSPLOWO2_01_FULL_37_12]|uniref:Uncharacterized protein n=1 Tax=Candidatus Roizmanbacteria bacterium RIFCSPLOWO2_01_FULL_37_12 TaxID=1802056 RepID=A0A1F7I7W4_9BACT|nr:MAG: hypothetical protein A2768_00240 [Candidatus Roizmanbacteria bacterium RIFCSPHIGHO2_01_FULL_37_16]OGK39467.1 MAG: hypothetical protein A2954_03245 [Candidatus Roizmanbacteria bacterium RIFCSPLOWO2_01_FULL_37_12]
MNIKKALISGAVSAALFGSLVMNVFAGAGKAPLYNAPANYTCPAGALPAATDPTFGFAVLNTTGNGWVIANVALKGATPNASYDIYVNQDPGGCPTVATGTLTTNGQGNGNANVKIPAVAGATAYWVSAVGGGQVLRSTAVASP